MAMTMPQGLRLEPMVTDIQRLLKVGARMYMCMTRATLDRHDRDGEMPVRLGLRAYGHCGSSGNDSPVEATTPTRSASSGGR